MQVDERAPVRAAREIEIAAAPETVWEVLTRFARWPSWNPDVTSMQAPETVAPGTEFTWTAGGVTIRSTVREVERPRRIGWRGKTVGTSATHVWRLTPRDGGTLVTTEESFAGWLPRLLRRRMQRTLDQSLEQGVRHLKAEAERRSAA